MKKVIYWTIGTLLLCGAGFGAYATFQEPTTPVGTTFKGMDLGSLTPLLLRIRLESWWETRKQQPLTAYSPLLEAQPGSITPAALAIKPDWDATIARIELETYTGKLLSQTKRGKEIQISWTMGVADTKGLAGFVKAHARAPQPARVTFENGAVIRKPEVTSFTLDTVNVANRAILAIDAGAFRFELPMVEQSAHVTKPALDSIREVVSSFTTRFSLGQSNRCSNIRLAAGKLNGHVLMPGDTISYNETVGQRLVSEGFKLAGVYKNGKHDVGIGGGICQVSTTLFNAAALANMKILQRSNHSMPVAYVPVGRDATVDYGSLDLKLRNTLDSPVAIASEVKGNTITFRMLGTKDPGLAVSILTTDHSSWGNSVQYVNDPALPAGKTKVVEKGSNGRRCVTWRIVKKDGEEIMRERLATSLYRPSTRIIARGPALPAASEPESEPPLPDQQTW